MKLSELMRQLGLHSGRAWMDHPDDPRHVQEDPDVFLFDEYGGCRHVGEVRLDFAPTSLQEAYLDRNLKLLRRGTPAANHERRLPDPASPQNENPGDSARDLLEWNGVLPTISVFPEAVSGATATFAVGADYGWAQRVICSGCYHQDALAIEAALNEAMRPDGG